MTTLIILEICAIGLALGTLAFILSLVIPELRPKKKRLQRRIKKLKRLLDEAKKEQTSEIQTENSFDEAIKIAVERRRREVAMSSALIGTAKNPFTKTSSCDSP